jgi:hypothetical protein
MKPFLQKHRGIIELLLLLLIAALTYLPFVSQFTFHRDDWYYIYDGIVLGPGAYPALFEHVRPLRGPVMYALFDLIGPNPLPYHLLLFTWRVLGGYAMFWLLRLLWPDERHRLTAFWSAVLFTIYPGFLWWVGGFEYQTMLMSVGIQAASLAFMVKGITAEKRLANILWTLASILTAWIYLGFVEYAIGMELFRVLAAFIVVSRGRALDSLKAWLARAWETLRAVAPSLLGPLFFLVWWRFIFENVRKAADVEQQLSVLSNGLQTLLAWTIHLLESAVNILFMAWTAPLYGRLALGDLRQIATELGLALLLIGLVLLLARFARTPDGPAEPETGRVGWEAATIGVLGVLGALVPIIVANRFVNFEQYSHYALPASIAVAVFLFGLLSFLSDERMRALAVSVLLVASAWTHFNLGANAANEAKVISGFWQQMAWRAPDLQPGTTLIVKYPGVTYAESSDLVWGPANIIYFSDIESDAPIHVPVTAARMEFDLIPKVMEGNVASQNYIIINALKFDYGNVLVISQSSAASCVHVLDARWPLLTPYDDATIRSVAPYSRVDIVRPDGSSPVPPRQLFGPEPTRGWCYYFERADLARQVDDWEQVSALGEEASQKGFAPAEPSEWVPFLQAQAILGDRAGIERIAQSVKKNDLFSDYKDYYRQQFCAAFAALDAQGIATSAEARALASNLFCP